jgi:putative membrane protein
MSVRHDSDRPSWRVFTAAPGQARPVDDLGQYRTHLAVLRTLMGADRSLMAWIRTALSMVGFGFTIYKFLQGYAAGGGSLGAAGEPRMVGLFLIGAGTVSIILGLLEYWQGARDLSAYEDIPVWRPVFVIALVIALFSVSLLGAVLLRVA